MPRRSDHSAAMLRGALALCAAGSGSCFRDWDHFEDARVSHESDAPPGAFRHPGILVDREQLDFVNAKISSGVQPWAGAFSLLQSNGAASVHYVPHAHADVVCGTDHDVGCNDEISDALASFAQARYWYYSGSRAFAQRAIDILDAWSANEVHHSGPTGAVTLAWTAEIMTRAAEILRYTNAGWPEDRAQRFGALMTGSYLPTVVDGWPGGNDWNLSMIDAAMNIAVYTDDHPGFDHAASLWRAAVPSFIYYHTDGATPAVPDRGTYTTSQVLHLWHDPPMLVDGMSINTCSSIGSVALGIGALIDTAETARIQGVDLYSVHADRIVAAFEFHTQFMNHAPVPSWLCGGTLGTSGAAPILTWEIGYNAYAVRMGMSLPQTATLLAAVRPTGAGLHLDWETLTHYGTGNVGIH